jgi:hypothetical protein
MKSSSLFLTLFFLLGMSISCHKDDGGPTGVPTQSQTSPAIKVSTNTVSLSAVKGGTNPPPQVVNVTNGGDGTLNGLSVSVSYSSGTGWLSASLNTTTAPATITLQAAMGSLGAGPFIATVSVVSSVASNSPQAITVTFTVSGPPPSIALSTSILAFTAQQGGANPSAQTLSVTNSGAGSLTGLSASVSYTSGAGWLSAVLNTTTAPAILTVQPTTGSLAAGTYTATISISSSSASNSPQTVNVSFGVSQSNITQTYYATCNLLEVNSAAPADANTVFANYSGAIVGTNYAYTYYGALSSYFTFWTAMRFNVQSAIAGKTIVQAQLLLYESVLPADYSGQFRLGAISSSWNPSTITWDNWSSTVTVYTASTFNFTAKPTTSVPITFDVTAIVQSWANGSWNDYGFLIWEPSRVAPGATSLQATSFSDPQLHIVYH